MILIRNATWCYLIFPLDCLFVIYEWWIPEIFFIFHKKMWYQLTLLVTTYLEVMPLSTVSNRLVFDRLYDSRVLSLYCQIFSHISKTSWLNHFLSCVSNQVWLSICLLCNSYLMNDKTLFFTSMIVLGYVPCIILVKLSRQYPDLSMYCHWFCMT